MPPKHKVLVSPTTDAVSRSLDAFVAERAARAIAARGRFVVGVSGGSLPATLAKHLAANSSLPALDKWTFVFADERHVPLDHADSNFAACEKALFAPLYAKGLLPENVLKINPAVPVAQAAVEYDTALKKIATQGESVVADLVLLGMGPDGHTASLFPGHTLLGERERWVREITDSPKPPPQRITLTYKFLNELTADVAFVCTGENKREMLHRILVDNEDLPSGRVSPTSGQVSWFLDEPAAAQLPASLLQK